jgi:hypothetical protein
MEPTWRTPPFAFAARWISVSDLPMTAHPRSLKYEYEAFVEQEIERYKESLPRHALLRIGDEAVTTLAAEQQLGLTEVLLCAEVDRIIRGRCRIPTYRTWCRRRLRAIEDFRRPERWGLHPEGGVARAMPIAAQGHVLVAGTHSEGTAMYLAANGCTVTALGSVEDSVERVVAAAVEVGLARQVRGLVGDLTSWAPDAPLTAVICAAAALAELSPAQRRAAIAALQQATTDGGIHVFDTIADATGEMPMDELLSIYAGWQVSVERHNGRADTVFATEVA